MDASRSKAPERYAGFSSKRLITHVGTMNDYEAYSNVWLVDGNKATVAVAREMLVIAYHMLKRKEPYRGVDDELYRSKLKRLERLGNSSLA